MPSKSPAQQRLMRAAAHNPNGFGGVPQSVGKDYLKADKKEGNNLQNPRKTTNRSKKP